MLKKSILIKPISKRIHQSISKWSADPINTQNKVFKSLLKNGEKTLFGKNHGFHSIKNYTDFKNQIPIRSYEDFKIYIDRILANEPNILWPGIPKYLAKTSGTTSGVKYIPLTKESIPNHVGTAIKTMLNFSYVTKHYDFWDGKSIFLSGSPKLDNSSQIPTGRLSGIVNHQVPAWLKSNQVPTYKTNCIEEWEEKLDQIVVETSTKDMRLISGIPPWVLMYFERLLDHSKKETIQEMFPNFSVFVHGGVNFSPYKELFSNFLSPKFRTVETYPASEGFIAFQDSETSDNGLLLNTNSGLFFEFIPLSEIHSSDPIRLALWEVETNIDYVLILSSNAGLWAYNIGDTIQFTSTNPYRLKVTGRVKHFISAFGEHVIGKEVEDSMAKASEEGSVSVVEFSVAPQVNPPSGELPFHEWFVEFDTIPSDVGKFAQRLNDLMMERNIYYEDLIKGNIIQPLKIRILEKNAFRNYMKSLGKLGGQNKVPRLKNDRDIADALSKYIS